MEAGVSRCSSNAVASEESTSSGGLVNVLTVGEGWYGSLDPLAPCPGDGSSRRCNSPDCWSDWTIHSGGCQAVGLGGGGTGATGLLVDPVSCDLSRRSLILSAAFLPVAVSPLGSALSLISLVHSGSG